MGLLGEIRTALTLKRAADRLKEFSKMGKLGPALYGLGASALTAAVAKFVSTCPALATSWKMLVGVVVMAGVKFLMDRPAAGWHAVLTGLEAAAVAAFLASLDHVCPGLWAQAPALAMAGVMTGVGHWLDTAKGGYSGAQKGSAALGGLLTLLLTASLLLAVSTAGRPRPMDGCKPCPDGRGCCVLP
jgi:hypothetical protein